MGGWCVCFVGFFLSFCVSVFIFNQGLWEGRMVPVTQRRVQTAIVIAISDLAQIMGRMIREPWG